jgi:uncharacterized protein (UPF0276 family)
MKKPSTDFASLGCGIGLHREHYDDLLNGHPPVRWFELISENFMTEGGRPRQVLDKVRSEYPVALHGVSLSVGSDEPLVPAYMERLEKLVREVDPLVVSDHLCWTRLSAHNSHDLLPLPFTEESVAVVAGKIREVQARLGRQMLIENVSTYLRFAGSTMTEWEFVTAVVEEADCGLLLDINNVYVNSRNHGFDPETYLAFLPPSRVRQYHMAGHEDHGDTILDTHDRPVTEEVWNLLRDAVRRFGPRPTILERDDQVPALDIVLAEADQAQAILDDPSAVLSDGAGAPAREAHAN